MSKATLSARSCDESVLDRPGVWLKYNCISKTGCIGVEWINPPNSTELGKMFIADLKSNDESQYTWIWKGQNVSNTKKELQNDKIALKAFIRHSIKRRVLEESTPIARIYDQELAAAQLTLPALSIAPTSREAQSSFQRLRRKTTPPLPVSGDFEIPDRYSQTLDGNNFLLSDTTVRNKRVLVFATGLQLAIFFQSSHIFMDGTFTVCPPYFDQVFTMHCIHHDQAIPCIIALLPGRSAMIYQYIFDLLDNEAKELGLTFGPDTITSDFEPGLIKAIKRQFHNSRHLGCYFHHTQSVYKKIQSLGLSSQYKNDEEVRSHARKLMAVPLLPLEKMNLAFEYLVDNHPACLDPLFNYYESFWMDSLPLKLWNVSNIKIKTNNIAEGKPS
ncbi:unnamed protein product [Rotaria sordida]|uniref:MULE transposase domain-containing protein n=1 Tax=Rotaria sordida TaxID=392033 RepID=A0A819LJC0_9BILA|nr:unnamed protein product [Rotaria sordida]CAF3967821.1 unnamed protein product [Rotaria sordida]